MNAPIRAMSTEALFVAGTVELQGVSLAYCGAAVATVPPVVWDECLSLLQNQFPNIGIYEIRQAFELAAASKLDVNIVAYRGQFTVDILGKVLAAYSEYRKAIHAAIINEREKEEEDRMIRERQSRMMRSYEVVQNKFHALVQCNNEIEKWQDVKAGDFIAMKEAGLLSVPETEKGKIWVKAKYEAVKAFNNDDTGLMSQNDILKIRKFIVSNPGAFPDELKARAITIYEKMLVFHSLPEFQMPF